jgi:hypothetical protein
MNGAKLLPLFPFKKSLAVGPEEKIAPANAMTEPRLIQ